MVRRVIVYLLAVLFTAVAAVPQQVRNGRIYPVASFGTTLAGLTITTNSEPDNGNGLLGIAVPFITGADPNGYSALDVAYYVQAAVTTSFDLGIYSNTSSAPATLLCHTSTGTITPANGWNSVAVSGCGILTANTTYWVAYITASNTIDQYRQDNVSCPGTSLNTVFTNVAQATATLPSTFGASTPDANCHNLYAVLSNLSTFGTNYYVSNSGSDANNGKSSATPWQTIAHVNAQSFSAGDSILFQAGGTWREQLTVPSSGSAGGPITFSAYGTGALPIISGADIFSSWTTETTIYYSPASTQPNQVFRDGTRLTLAASKAALATGQWWWDSTNNRIYVYDNPTGQTIEASQRADAIYISGQSDVTISSVEADKAQLFNLWVYTSSNVVVSGVTSLQAFGQAINWDHSPSGTISSCITAYNGADGITFTDCPNMLIDECVVHDNDQLTNDVYSSGIHSNDDARGSTNFVIQRSEVYSNGTGQSGQIGGGIWVDTVGDGGIIRYNRVYSNNFAGIYLDADNGETVIGNVVYNNGVAGSENWGTFGILVNADWNTTLTNTVVNNTVYGNYYGGIAIFGPYPEQAGGCTNNIVENNIATGTVSGPNLSTNEGCENPGTNGSGNVYTYNDFGPEATNFITWGASNYSTYATWEAAAGNCGTTGCSHSTQTNPTFYNSSAGQFWLTSGSPGIAAGTTLGSPYNVGLVPGGSWPNSVATGPTSSPPTIGSYLYAGTVWPIGKSSNGRYLVDAISNPWLMVADSPWTLTCKLTPAQQAQYFADRKARGFNSVLVVILPTDYTGCSTNTQALYDGTVPFTTGTTENNYTYSSENSSYFTEIDAMVNLAATYNLTVLMDPIDTGINSGNGSLIAARLSANSSAGMYALGQYLGNRYKSFPNIIWVAGDDFGTWQSATTYNGYTDLQLFHQLLAGIANKDTAHLIGTELNIPNYQNQDGTSPSGLVTLDSAYTYNSTYDLMLSAYNSTPVIPTFLVEANYEYDNDTSMLSPWPGTPPTGPSITYDLVPRLESWWVFTSGGAGEIWGQYYESTGNFAAANWLGPNGSGYIPYNTQQTSPINGGTISTTSANDLLFYYAANAGLAFTGDAWTVSGFTHPTCVADSGYNAGCSVTSSSAIRSLTAIKVMTTPGWAPASIVSTAATSGEYGTLYAAFRPVSTSTPPAFVQANGADTASAAYSSNVTSGNALYAMVFGSPNGTTISVTSTHETFTTVASGVLATDGDEIAIACAIANGTHSDTVTATATGGVSPAISRIQIYEASGATCALDTSAGGGIDSPGAYQIQYINSFFNSIAWQNMVPDQTHQIVTAGYGTYVATGVAVGQNLLTNNYVTTSWNPNGKLAVIYDPSGNTLTINMAKFTGSVTAQWYDPSNGAYAPVAGSPFSNTSSQVIATPGANSRGSADWVLLLTAP